jgi:hypothetical protein
LPYELRDAAGGRTAAQRVVQRSQAEGQVVRLAGAAREQLLYRECLGAARLRHTPAQAALSARARGAATRPGALEHARSRLVADVEHL